MTTLKTWFYLALIFTTGGVSGAALTVGLGSHFTHGPAKADLKTRWMQHLTDKLHLTADQQTKIEPTLSDAVSKIQVVRREEGENLAKIYEQANSQIETALTPEQITGLHAMTKEMEDREKNFSGHKGMHGDHEKSWGKPADDTSMLTNAPAGSPPAGH